MSTLVLATRVDVGFERVRMGVLGPHVVRDGRLSIDLPSLDRLAGGPAALVFQLRGGREATPIEIRFDGVPVTRLSLPAGKMVRVDAAVHPSAGQSHRLELLGEPGDWRLRQLEVANVHGFSRGLVGLAIVPRSRELDRPLPWGAIVLIAVALLVWRPRWDWPQARVLRVLHRAAVVLVVVMLATVLSAEWFTPYRLLVAPHTMLLALAILHAGRLQRGALRLLSLASPSRAMPAAALLIAAAVLSTGVLLGSRGVGGADVYGYVSQVDLLRQGRMRVHQPIAAAVPWPDPDWTLSPLGYAPGGDHTIVPTYPPGLPLLILLLSLVFGPLSPFLVAPVCAAALVLLTYRLGARIASPLVGLVAAASVGTSPTVLFMMLTPMSDVPVAAFWTASLLLAYRRTPRASIGAGLAAGAAILIRPNLVFLAPIPLLVAAWHQGGSGRHISVRRAAAVTLACAPFALFIAWWFNELYGSPLRSGYGDTSSLFAWEHVRQNLSTYPVWLWETEGPLVFLAVLSPLVASRGHDRFIRLVGLALIGLVTTCYLLYIPFDAWWFLRFFVVAFPLLFILSADAVSALAARVTPMAGHLALGLVTAVTLYYGITTSWRHGVLGAGRADQKYADVGRYAQRHLPPNAVVYSMQHSSTIRYYSDVLTVRWTHVKTDWLDRSIAYWIEAGYEPIVLLDDWEVPQFRNRFDSTRYGAMVAGAPASEPCTHSTFVYWLVERPGLPPAIRVPRTGGCE